MLRALVVHGAQVAVVVCAAAAAEALCRVADPRVRLALWRGAALACLTLPLSALAGPRTPGAGVTFLVASVASAAEPGAAVLPAGELLWWTLCAGALARLAWLCAGAVRLRHLRHGSRPVVLTPALEEMREAIAPRVELRTSCDIAQPVAFGLRRPVVLVPERFFAMAPDAQRAVACHELLHVARGDCASIVIEEAARSLFWFNPAVWWLVDRIQQSREQLVDRLVIARVPSKRAYMAALLAFAGAARPAALATAFLRRHHLRSRLQKLAKESVMSKRRLAWTGIVLTCVMGGAIGGTAAWLPLHWPDGRAAARAQDVVDGGQAGVTMPKVVREVKPQYTPEALKARIEGTVLMRAVVRTDGTPGEIEITRSLDATYGLDEQARTALGQWRFEPGRKDGKPVAVRVTVEMRFTLKK